MFQWNALYIIQIIPVVFIQAQYSRPSWNYRTITAKRINEVCSRLEECLKNDYNSICAMGWMPEDPVCRCKPGFRNLADKCVLECQDNDVCQVKDSNSVCLLKQGICGCRNPYIRRRGKCVKVKKPGERCYNSEDCKKGDSNSYCVLVLGSVNRTCECLPDFLYVKEKCQKISHYTFKCSEDSECTAADPNTVCVNNYIEYRSCMCTIGFIFSPPANKCVYELNNNNLTPKKPSETASLVAIIGTVTCVGVLLISLFLCAYRQRRESLLRSRSSQVQVIGEADESLPARDSTLRRSIRSFLARIGQSQPYTDPPPPYDLVVAQKAAINNPDNPPSYTDIFQTSQEYTNRAFIPDPGPSHNI